MAENEGGSSSAPTKGKKKLKGWQIGAMVGGAAVLGYLGYRYYEDRAASSAASVPTSDTTPTEDTTGTGSNDATGDAPGSAIDPSTGDDYSNESPFASTDTATGQTFAAEIEQIESELGSIYTGATSVNVNPSGPGSDGGTTLDAWKAATQAELEKHGSTPAEASQAITEYLNGQAVSGSLGTAVNLQNIVNNSAPPTASGSAAPVVVSSKGTTATAERAQLVTTQRNLVADEAKAKSDPTKQNTAAVKALSERENTLKKA